jgi:hypothetical protein
MLVSAEKSSIKAGMEKGQSIGTQYCAIPKIQGRKPLAPLAKDAGIIFHRAD